MSKKKSLAAYRAEWKIKGLCLNCGSRSPFKGTTRCYPCLCNQRAANKRHVEKTQAQRKAKYEERRLRVLAHYGLTCACCGEDNPRFLTLDHINNDGFLHRKNMRKNIYAWVDKYGYPDTLQTLCFNCNCGKAHNGGICPHKTAELTLAVAA